MQIIAREKSDVNFFQQQEKGILTKEKEVTHKTKALYSRLSIIRTLRGMENSSKSNLQGT